MRLVHGHGQLQQFVEPRTADFAAAWIELIYALMVTWGSSMLGWLPVLRLT